MSSVPKKADKLNLSLSLSRFVVIQILIMQNYAHGMGALLSWDVPKKIEINNNNKKIDNKKRCAKICNNLMASK